MSQPRGLIVVGASAGGVEALRSFVAGLPVTLDAAVCVVLHIPRSGTSALPSILNRAGPLPVVDATDGCRLAAGTVYVAPANAHMLVDDGHLRLSRGPTENGHRPAVDPLFRSAARAWGRGVVGVVLSGSRDDGAFGLASIARHGGAALVQDPAEALYPSMPRHAAELVTQSRAVPVSKMGAVIEELLNGMSGAEPVASAGDARLDAENAMDAMENLTAEDAGGVPAGFGCPSCNSAVFELPGSQRPLRFRCRVGHAWTAVGLLEEQGEALEGALWMALRSLEEKAALSRRMADSASSRGSTLTAERYREVGGDAERAGRVIRQLIEQLTPVEDRTPPAGEA